jgi:hypothetical protein
MRRVDSNASGVGLGSAHRIVSFSSLQLSKASDDIGGTRPKERAFLGKAKGAEDAIVGFGR